MNNITIKKHQNKAMIEANKLKDLEKWRRLASYWHLPFYVVRLNRGGPRYCLVITGEDKHLARIVIENWR